MHDVTRGRAMEYSVAQAREQFAEVINEVKYAKQRAIIKKHGKEVVAVISVEDLNLLRKLEDLIDMEAVMKASEAGEDHADWAEVRKELLGSAALSKGGIRADVPDKNRKSGKKVVKKAAKK